MLDDQISLCSDVGLSWELQGEVNCVFGVVIFENAMFN